VVKNYFKYILILHFINSKLMNSVACCRVACLVLCE